MLTHLSLNKVSTLIAVIGALYMQFFLRDSVIDDKHLYTPIISQGNPIISKVNGNLESKKHLLKALRSIKDLTSFLNSRCFNFLSYSLIRQLFFILFHNFTSMMYTQIFSLTINQAAIVAFFNIIADVGLHGSLLVCLFFFFKSLHIFFLYPVQVPIFIVYISRILYIVLFFIFKFQCW